MPCGYKLVKPQSCDHIVSYEYEISTFPHCARNVRLARACADSKAAT